MGDLDLGVAALDDLGLGQLLLGANVHVGLGLAVAGRLTQGELDLAGLLLAHDDAGGLGGSAVRARGNVAAALGA